MKILFLNHLNCVLGFCDSKYWIHVWCAKYEGKGFGSSGGPGGEGGGGGHPIVDQPQQVVYGQTCGVQITEAKVLVAV